MPRDVGKDRPCLNYHIHQCLAPCQGYVSKEEYGIRVNNALEFLNGNYNVILKDFEEKMKTASENMEFEEAAKFRDLYNSVKQVAQNYLKFRNTARYCLGNLDGFDPDNLVAAEDMEELDKWALTKLDSLIKTVRKAYNSYEFHVVAHAINDFCVVELSSFYLDIIKDRLYCEAKDGLRRRSAQSALFLILDAMAKLFAPILAFTCDEIWQSMPHRSTDDGRNVLLNQMPENCDGYLLSQEAMEKWAAVMKVRQDVNGVLELARADKRIGKALEAHVSLWGDEAAKNACEGLNLAEIFIVSSCDWEEIPENATKENGTNFPALTVGVTEAKGEKCPRCWMHSLQANAEGLCPRCAAVISEMDLDI